MAHRMVAFDRETITVDALVATVVSGGRARELDGGRAFLERFEGLGGLACASPKEIEEAIVHVGYGARESAAAARAIVAALELGRRAAIDATPRTPIGDGKDVAAWARPRIGAIEHEELWLLALDGRSRLKAACCVARGGLHGVGVRAADPLRIALRAGASGFVLVHNHPSGDPTPSAEDVLFTRKVASAAAVCGVPLLDHVVVAREGFASVPFSAAGEIEGG